MNIRRVLALSLVSLAIGGLTPILMPVVALESSFALRTLGGKVYEQKQEEKPLPAAVPTTFNPLLDPMGNPIVPVDTEFGIIVPKIGINARVIPGVDPVNPSEYSEALKAGVAHSKLSFFPDEEGVVYLFSHSTNAEWFVAELNAIFYLLKNLEAGDLIILTYHGQIYTYRLKETRIVKPTDTSFLKPIEGPRMLILQTCWPPGSTTERLLIISELIDRQTL